MKSITSFRNVTPRDFGVDVVDGEADVVEAQLVEAPGIRVGLRGRVAEMEELDFEARLGARQNHRQMLRLQTADHHVGGEGFARDDGIVVRREPQ